MIRNSTSSSRLALLFVGFATLAPASLRAAPPWETPFQGDPAAILKGARAAKDDGESGATILLEEGEFAFDAAGRLTRRLRYVVRVDTPAAVETWASLEATWAPWHQSRPTLKARVLTPDGTVHTLDEKTISDAPAGDDDSGTYSDRRVTRAPLPALVPGAVVEEETVVRDTEPRFSAGTVHRFYFGAGAATEATRLVLRYPAALPLRYQVSSRLGIAPRRSEEGGVLTLVFESDRLEPIDDFEAGAPSDESQERYVELSTGPSWSAVAKAYDEIVDRQLGNASRTAPRPPADREATIRHLLARLQRDVRYTGIEFSEATIVPRTPAETARRGYGDCKDKAAFLVGRLREAGIPAQVALLFTGPGPDLDPALPGLVFDHVIVHVPGPPALWIDPTDELARAGELPAGDQGRWALVASHETTALVRTPEATSSQNCRIGTREFRLQDSGPAHVVEIREATGSLERYERARFSGGTRKALQETVENYAKEEFLSKGKVRFEIGEPRDLDRPFRVRIEAEQAGRGDTGDVEAVVALFPASLLRRLPATLRSNPKEDEKEEEGAETPRKKKVRARTRDFVFDEPFTEGWIYRVHPPPGYGAPTLPDSSEERVGTGRLIQSYRTEPDGSISATITFDSGKRRLTPAELEAYRKAVAALLEKPVLMLRFGQLGRMQLEAGRIREALGEFRALSAARPKKGIHRSQMALALLSGGLGEAARREARKGAEIEPSAAHAWQTLGWVLQHDLLGRRFSPGFDRAGAIAAYRKARELDPKSVAIRADLAILLEHDADGVRYSPTASLREATEEYRSIRKELDSAAFDVNLMIVLFQQQRFDELAETVRALPPSDTGNDCLVLAAAAREGADAARREAARLIPDATRRRDALERVAQTLIQLRLYPPAAAILSEIAGGSPKAADLRARADLISRTRRWDAEPLTPEDPKSVAKLFYVAVLGGRVDDAAALFTRDVARSLEGKEGREGLRQILRALRRPTTSGGAPKDTLLDLLFAVMQISVEGSDEQGYRLRIRGAGGGGEVDQKLYLVREEGRLKILSSDYTPSALGEEALRRSLAGDDTAARLWLDRAREHVSGDGGDDPLGGSPFARLWTRGAPSSAERVRLAARVLAVDGDDAARHVDPLRKARDEERPSDEKRAIDLALTRALLQEKRWEELLTVVARLESEAPDSDLLFRLRQTALLRLQRRAEARRAAEERLARKTDDPTAVRALSQIATVEGDFATADKVLRQLVERGTVSAGDYNELAWRALFTQPLADQAIADAQRAVEMTRSSRYPILHTLAALYAETGRTTEARDLILKALDLSGRDEPASSDFYVLGRIAEQYGESVAAIEAYRKVERNEEDEPAVVATATLAQRRLDVLGAAKKGNGK